MKPIFYYRLRPAFLRPDVCTQTPTTGSPSLRPQAPTSMGELVLNNPALSKPAILALEDGSVFHGTAIGADGVTSGEVVFNTAMTGYQEILTDPSYTRQIVTLTYPHIGNTGINSEDVESASIAAAGLVIRDLPLLASSFRSEQTLSD